jgi:hypothetical protein
MSRDTIMLEDLPPIAQRIAEGTSINVAVAFCRDFGGGIVSIPTRYRPQGALARRLGEHLLRALIAEFPGRALQVPRLAAVDRRQRDDRIRMDRAAGMSNNEIAMKYNLTIRHVCRILGN